MLDVGDEGFMEGLMMALHMELEAKLSGFDTGPKIGVVGEELKEEEGEDGEKAEGEGDDERKTDGTIGADIGPSSYE